MSLHYIVDGYNALRRSGLFARKELRQERAAFFAYLENRRPQGSRRNRLTVVFDGSSSVFGVRDAVSFEVVFTATGESADERIKALVGEARRPRDVVVVTDDRALGYAVRDLGAAVMATASFLKKGVPMKPAARNKIAAAYPDKAELNIVERERITEEMEKIWLRKK